jgi:hypothetical protein
VTLSGKSGASSDKAEDEGVAGSYVEDENAVRGVIWLAGTHDYLRDATLDKGGVIWRDVQIVETKLVMVLPFAVAVGRQ